MQQLRLAGFRVAVARLHAARLEVAAVGAGRNLTVLVLARHPDFQVVGLHRGEAHVAGAQRQLAVRQLQQLQHALGVGGHAFQRLEGLGRLDDLHHLDLVELVLADHAAGVATGSARLTAEARGMGDELQWQLFGIENFAGDDIGQRDLGSRDQVQVGLVFTGDLEQVFLEFRQLTGALQRRSLHQIRGVGLFVAMLAGVQVDHELRQGAMQTGDGAAQQGETRARQLGSGLEVQPAVLLAEGDVILDLEIEAARGAPTRHLDVAVFIGANRHGLVRQVGNVQQQVVQLVLDRIQLTLAGFQLAAHLIDFRQQRSDVFATRLGLADGLGTAVALGLQLLGAHLHRLALTLQGLEAGDVKGEATGGEALGDFGELRADKFGIEHVRVSIHRRKKVAATSVTRVAECKALAGQDANRARLRPAQAASRPPRILNAR